MKNIINITPHGRPITPKMGKEDTAHFADKFEKAASADAYYEVMQSLYKHGYEDGYNHGRKHGKIIKLISI